MEERVEGTFEGPTARCGSVRRGSCDDENARKVECHHHGSTINLWDLLFVVIIVDTGHFGSTRTGGIRCAPVVLRNDARSGIGRHSECVVGGSHHRMFEVERIARRATLTHCGGGGGHVLSPPRVIFVPLDVRASIAGEGASESLVPKIRSSHDSLWLCLFNVRHLGER